MEKSNFYQSLSGKQVPSVHGIIMNVATTAPKAANISKSTHSITASDLAKVVKEKLERRLHVNGSRAGLFFYTRDNLPWTGSMYYALDGNCPNFIARNIHFHKYLGEVKVISIEGNQMVIDTIQGRKTVLKSVFVRNAVDSIKQWVGKDELERLQFNARMDNTENNYTNHCCAL